MNIWIPNLLILIISLVTAIRNGVAKCGERQDGVIFRIEPDGPEETDLVEFPWTVVVFQTKSVEHYLGVGSLIHPRVVLSAAHLFTRRRNRKYLAIRAGAHHRKNVTSLFKTQESFVDECILHEEFDTGNPSHDIALLILRTPIRQAKNVGFACLPPASMETPPPTLCIVSGWGAYAEGEALVEKKKMVELPIVGRRECESMLHSIPGVNPLYRVSASMMCAGGEEGIDSCGGDGGAPLVCPYPDSELLYQAGVTSFGVGCGREGRPGVYTSVAAARPWIDGKLQELSLQALE